MTLAPISLFQGFILWVRNWIIPISFLIFVWELSSDSLSAEFGAYFGLVLGIADQLRLFAWKNLGGALLKLVRAFLYECWAAFELRMTLLTNLKEIEYVGCKFVSKAANQALFAEQVNAPCAETTVLIPSYTTAYNLNQILPKINYVLS